MIIRPDRKRPVIGLIRLRSRTAEDGKTNRPIVQRFCWWRLILLQNPWCDWFPAINAIRNLQHEFIEIMERAEVILAQDLPDAEQYIEACYKKLANLDTSAPFVDQVLPREGERPDATKRFELIQKLFPNGRISPDRPVGLARTLYYMAEGRIDPDKFAKKDLGATFNEIMRFKIPQVFRQGPPQQQGQNQQQKGKGNQNQDRKALFSWMQ